MARGQYRTCEVCGENYDCGERHKCEGTVETPQPPKQVDKHLEACMRLGMYVQPGFRSATRKRAAGLGAERGQKQVNAEGVSGILASGSERTANSAPNGSVTGSERR